MFLTSASSVWSASYANHVVEEPLAPTGEDVRWAPQNAPTYNPTHPYTHTTNIITEIYSSCFTTLKPSEYTISWKIHSVIFKMLHVDRCTHECAKDVAHAQVTNSIVSKGMDWEINFISSLYRHMPYLPSSS
jgi:hypothetical protein